MNQPHTRQAGFSLIELLMAVALFMIVTGAIYGMMNIASNDRLTTNQRVEILQSARNALNAIGRDALNAGNGFPRAGARLPDNVVSSINGLPNDTGNALDVLPPVVAGRLLNANNINPNGTNTDQISFIYQDQTFNNGLPVTVTNVAANGGQITINTNGPDGIAGNADDINNGIFRTNDLIMINGPNLSAVGMVTAPPGGAAANTVFFSAAAPLGINVPGAGTNGISAINAGGRTATRITWVRYRVLANGTLVRTVIGNAPGATGWSDQPLAYNIEAMNVEYVIVNGAVTATSVNPGAGPDAILGTADDTPGNLLNVRQARVTLTIRSPQPDMRNNQFFRTTLTSTFNTRNLGYDTR